VAEGRFYCFHAGQEEALAVGGVESRLAISELSQ
jgi:hypothetical protein